MPRNTMNHTINNIRPASVLIEVGKRKKPMEFFAQQLVNGIALGSVYALSAIGYSLVYAVLELINFTHGTMYMVGAYLFLIFVSMCSMPYWLSFILAVLLFIHHIIMKQCKVMVYFETRRHRHHLFYIVTIEIISHKHEQRTDSLTS